MYNKGNKKRLMTPISCYMTKRPTIEFYPRTSLRFLEPPPVQCTLGEEELGGIDAGTGTLSMVERELDQKIFLRGLKGAWVRQDWGG